MIILKFHELVFFLKNQVLEEHGLTNFDMNVVSHPVGNSE